MAAHILIDKQEPTGMIPSNAPLGSESILLISQDMGTRILIRNALFHQGYLVLEASDEEAAAYICNLMGGKIDLLIADVAAPQLDSWAHRGLPIPPILVLVDSAAVSGDTPGMATRVKYLVAPLSHDGIAVEVRALLDSPK